MTFLRKLWRYIFDPSPPRVLYMVGETGTEPVIEGDAITFAYRSPIIIPQMLHERQPGGVLSVALDVWIKLPAGYIGFLYPDATVWATGQILETPRILRPGWQGELSITVSNLDPEEPAALPANAPGFRLILHRAVGALCLDQPT